jgi:hypothetical protein
LNCKYSKLYSCLIFLLFLSGCYSGPYRALVPVNKSSDAVAECLYGKIEEGNKTLFGQKNTFWLYSRLALNEAEPPGKKSWEISGKYLDRDRWQQAGYWANVLKIEVIPQGSQQSIINLQHVRDWSYAGRGQLKNILNDFIPECSHAPAK